MPLYDQKIKSQEDASENGMNDQAVPRPSVSVLVVSYNTRELTISCLRSIQDQTSRVPYEVIAIDNCSSDGSWQAIEEEFGDHPQFRVLRSESNLGFGRANNKIAGLARGRLLLLLNPDTVVIDNAIDRLASFADANPSAGIWGGRTVDAEGRLDPTSSWADFSLRSVLFRAVGLSRIFAGSAFFNPRAYPNWNREQTREVDIVTGCFLLIDASVWRTLGGFDSQFFMYGEEADLCWRARKLGCKPLATGDATVIHLAGQSEVCSVDRWVKLMDGELRVIERQFAVPSARLAVVVYLAQVLARAVFFRLVSPSRGEMWAGVWRRRREWARWPGRKQRLAEDACQED